EERPGYALKKYSPYENSYLDGIGNSEKDDIYHYGSSLVDLIQQCPEQEIGSHTFSHYYCLENASLSSFEADLLAARRIAAARGIELKTIIFPRNQYSTEHLLCCKKHGFLAYRGNENSVVYRPRKNEDQEKAIRAARLTDAYINLTGHHSFDAGRSYDRESGLVNLPASRFLRPYSARLSPLDGLRLSRIKKSMSFAATRKEAYHLWWHPHNFGANLKENLAFLEAILQHYRHLNQRFGMESRTMRAIAEETLEPHAI
ncbi:MAG TPA: hypothetical protein VFR58_14960, partial [Flavisolibacter sp.]|nr:hypothetical protein [Flavisolibacter sp.]